MRNTEVTSGPEQPSAKRLVELYIEKYLPRWLVRVFFYLISIASVIWLGYLFVDNWQNLKEYKWNIRWDQVVISFLLYALAVALALITWVEMMGTFDASPTWQEHVRSYCISRLGLRLPGPMLHIPGRLLLYHGKISSRVIWIVSTMELVVMLCACVILSTATSQLFAKPIYNYLAALAAIGLLTLLPKIIVPIFKMINVSIPTQINLISIIKWTIYHIGIWVLGAGSVFALIGAFYSIRISQLLDVISAWATSGLVSILVTFLPMGLGLRELSLSLLLDRFFPTEVALLTVILTRFVLLIYDLIIAVMVYFIPSRNVNLNVGVKEE